MAILRFSSGDVSGFKLLFSLAILYGVMSILVYSRLHMKFVNPLGDDAPLDKFSEARALQHLRVLSKEIDGRQVGRPGLRQAANYIKDQLEMIKERANSSFRVEIDESTVNGSFNMLFLGHSISFGYRAHTNFVMRISSIDAVETDASVLLNAHFDSPLGSPGAGDCGSCVASLLELARLVVQSGWVPPKPIIFLFNGAEELFMLGSHGFITTHKWRDTIGAFVNVEASGTGGPDLVCQSGPGSWPSSVYAKAAIYPMAHSAAQDLFSVVPGDTDFRIFAQDFGKIPGLDIIFLLGGYFYHTSYDTFERILPGSIQARGENLFSVVKAFASSPFLRNASERHSLASALPRSNDERAIFFDFLAWFMVYYSKNLSRVLHALPMVIFVLMPFYLCGVKSGTYSYLATFCGFLKGFFLHFIAIILAIIVPTVLAFLRLVFSGYAMSWFANPYLAFLMFTPGAVIGLLIPTYALSYFPGSLAGRRISKKEHAVGFWGTFGFYAVLCLAFLAAGLSGSFLTFLVSVSLLISYTFCQLINCNNVNSLRSVACYILPLVPCLIYSVNFGGFLIQFLIEKTGMMGAIQPPFGFYIQDIVVAAMTGVATGWCLGPLLPIVGDWLAKSSILQFLLHLSVLAMALSSQFFPYSSEAPKRVVMQHTVITADATRVLNSTYDFTVVDSNDLAFLFKHSPVAAAELKIGSEFSFETSKHEWLAIFPISTLFSRTLKVPVRYDDILKQYKYFPHLSMYKPHEVSDEGIRKIHLEFNLGSLDEVWVAVLNITGPLSSWSFADERIPAPERIDGGPPSHICRLSGASTDNWTFWLKANSSEALRVEVAVVDQRRTESTERLLAQFPDWVDVVAYTSYMSIYFF